MGMQQGALSDSEKIDVMRRALDEAIAKLPPELRSDAITSSILKAASPRDLLTRARVADRTFRPLQRSQGWPRRAGDRPAPDRPGRLR